jgi:3-oxoacyl-[acyl-carrier-protein] synthase II
MKNRVVITGVGVTSAVGTGVDNFWQALASGRCGINYISSFDAIDLPCRKAGQIANFQIGDHVSYKGSNSFSRAAQFVCAAASMALREAKLESPLGNRNDVGVVLGTAFGSASSMEAFDEECIRDGERFVDPMSFPKTVANSPAGCLSILIGATGFNITVSTDFASGLGAVEYAASLIAEGRARIVVAGGYEEFSRSSHVEMLQAGLLSRANENGLEDSVPLDRNRNGFFLGEGAGVLVLEGLEEARARQAPIVAELAGFGTTSCLDSSQVGESQYRAMCQAIRQAGLRLQDIAYVSASANGSIETDRQERLSVERLFGDSAGRLPVTAIKSMIGECGGAAGAMQLIAAALSTRHNAVTPTAGFQEGEAGALLRKIMPARQAADCSAILVNNFSGENNNSSAVVTRLPN